jgi:hypothetical protein
MCIYSKEKAGKRQGNKAEGKKLRKRQIFGGEDISW